MRQNQLPLLGLLLALFVSARVGIPGSASEGGSSAGSAEKTYSSSSQLAKDGTGRAPAHSAKAPLPATEGASASSLVQSGCDEITAT
jgi:hypothetical protein